MIPHCAEKQQAAAWVTCRRFLCRRPVPSDRQVREATAFRVLTVLNLVGIMYSR
jgi:hypothetical protein